MLTGRTKASLKKNEPNCCFLRWTWVQSKERHLTKAPHYVLRDLHVRVAATGLKTQNYQLSPMSNWANFPQLHVSPVAF